MSKKAKLFLVLGSIVLVLAVGLVVFFSQYMLLNGQLVRRNAETVVLEGEELPPLSHLQKLKALKTLDARSVKLPITEYESLRRQFPQWEILWEVPVGDGTAAQDVRTLEVTGFTREDLGALRHLPELQELTLSACEDYDALLQAKGEYPNLRIRYTLKVGSALVQSDATALAAENMDPARLPSLIACLPKLESVIFTGTQPDCKAAYALVTAYPHISFRWDFTVQGVAVSTDTAELDLRGLESVDFEALRESMNYFTNLRRIHAEGCRDYDGLIALQEAWPQVEVLYTVELEGEEIPSDIDTLTVQDLPLEQLRELLHHLPKLQKLELTGTLPSNEELYELMCEYPAVLIGWDLTVCGVKTNTAATTLILSGIPMADTSTVEESLKYFGCLERVEMCNCGIPSSQMDALSKKFPEIRFVWTVKVGRGTVRTDIKALIPYKFRHDIDDPLYDKDCTELKYCVDLECLDLGHMRMRDISFLQYMPKMKYLILGDTPVRDFSSLAYLKELIYLEIFNTKFTDHELLLGMSKLEDLNIGYTPATDASVLEKMTWLKRLWVPGTRIGNSGYQKLVAALPDTQVVMYVAHSTAGNWRDNQNYRDMRDMLGMYYMK